MSPLIVLTSSEASFLSMKSFYDVDVFLVEELLSIENAFPHLVWTGNNGESILCSLSENLCFAPNFAFHVTFQEKRNTGFGDFMQASIKLILCSKTSEPFKSQKLHIFPNTTERGRYLAEALSSCLKSCLLYSLRIKAHLKCIKLLGFPKLFVSYDCESEPPSPNICRFDSFKNPHAAQLFDWSALQVAYGIKARRHYSVFEEYLLCILTGNFVPSVTSPSRIYYVFRSILNNTGECDDALEISTSPLVMSLSQFYSDELVPNFKLTGRPIYIQNSTARWQIELFLNPVNTYDASQNETLAKMCCICSICTNTIVTSFSWEVSKTIQFSILMEIIYGTSQSPTSCSCCSDEINEIPVKIFRRRYFKVFVPHLGAEIVIKIQQTPTFITASFETGAEQEVGVSMESSQQLYPESQNDEDKSFISAVESRVPSSVSSSTSQSLDENIPNFSYSGQTSAAKDFKINASECFVRSKKIFNTHWNIVRLLEFRKQFFNFHQLNLKFWEHSFMTSMHPPYLLILLTSIWNSLLSLHDILATFSIQEINQKDEVLTDDLFGKRRAQSCSKAQNLNTKNKLFHSKSFENKKSYKYKKDSEIFAEDLLRFRHTVNIELMTALDLLKSMEKAPFGVQSTYKLPYDQNDPGNVIAHALLTSQAKNDVESDNKLNQSEGLVKMAIDKTSKTTSCPTYTDESGTIQVQIKFEEKFHQIRQNFGISTVQFASALSVSGKHSLPGGKSNAQFLVSHDNAFLLKKLNGAEFRFVCSERFLDVLNLFVSRGLGSNKVTLLAPTLGIYVLANKGMFSPIKQTSIYSVYPNLLQQHIQIHMSDPSAPLVGFDLKGFHRVRKDALNEDINMPSFSACDALQSSDQEFTTISSESSEALEIITDEDIECKNDTYSPPEIPHLVDVMWDTQLFRATDGIPLVVPDGTFASLLDAIKRDTKTLCDARVIDYSILLFVDPVKREFSLAIIDYFQPFTWDKMCESVGKKMASILKANKETSVINPQEYRRRLIQAFYHYFLPSDPSILRKKKKG
eukprot:GHVP01003677.1.p1 GENE.GHVP01003677.1~~GHVP01003677.1.p1  ORF type:complete len:1029 (+),score=182.00 GHVP01003677.1:835-3921(+)